MTHALPLNLRHGIRGTSYGDYMPSAIQKTHLPLGKFTLMQVTPQIKKVGFVERRLSQIGSNLWIWWT